MPLDTAGVTDGLSLPFAGASSFAHSQADAGVHLRKLDSEQTIGAALRAERGMQGLDLDYLSEITRVPPRYLVAIEEMRLEDLPSRTFVVGYVRAYARALRCDPEAAAARFRRDAPEDDQSLRAPVGVRKEADPRLTMLLGAGAVVVLCVAGWNIAERIAPAAGRHHQLSAVVAQDVAQSAARSAQLPPPAADQGPLTLGAPLPAPAESTTPTPYVTPGLPGYGDASSAPAKGAAAAAKSDPVLPQPFVAQGTVYGARPGQTSIVTLQAVRDTSLVIHGAGGEVYFARMLKTGEAYRAPTDDGLSIDVSEPDAFDYYVGGALKGTLPAPKAKVSDLSKGQGQPAAQTPSK